MLAVTRHRVPESDQDGFLAAARTALTVLSARPGYVRGRIGRAADDPELWLVTTEWLDIGSYRRALSAYDVKVGAVPLLGTAEDEPTAYELLVRDDPGGRVEESSARAHDAGTAGPGRR